MRHVSRTHRVALDWLFERVNLDSKIQTRYTDTKHQLADILTKGNFTRDERNNLLYLFIISHFSSLCCAQNFSLTSRTKTMAKRVQEQREDNRIVAKSKPTTMTLTSSVATSSSSVNSPIASKSPGILKASGRQKATRNSWIIQRLEVQGNLSHQDTKDIQETQELQEVQKNRDPKAKICHIISIFHQTVCLTWTRSSRS